MKSRRYSHLVILGAASMLLGGCAVFSGGSSSGEPGFRSQATASEYSMPLPVEIAQEIATITESGALIVRRPPVKERAESARKENAPLPQNEELPQSLPEKVESSVPPPVQEPQPQRPRRIIATKKRSSGPLGFQKVIDQQAPRAPSGEKQTVFHQVKSGDTLMKISFANYGNVYRWREIYRDNQDKIVDFNRLKEGTLLTINNVEYVFIRRNGKPYLIIRDDTLIKISKKLYGTPAKWRALWKNNPQLIRDPNKIYAGFTLYYEPVNQETPMPREPANSQ